MLRTMSTSQLAENLIAKKQQFEKYKITKEKIALEETIVSNKEVVLKQNNGVFIKKEEINPEDVKVPLFNKAALNSKETILVEKQELVSQDKGSSQSYKKRMQGGYFGKRRR